MRNDDVCETCHRPYSFIRAKYTKNDGHSVCLTCAAEEERVTPAKSIADEESQKNPLTPSADGNYSAPQASLPL